MNVRAISEKESSTYNTLAREYGTVFHSAEWTALFGDRLQRYGIFTKNGELMGGFHLYKFQAFGIDILRNPPFTPTIGPFFKIMARHPVAVLEARREILSAVAHFLNNWTHAIVSVSLDPELQDMMPFFWKEFKVVPRYTNRIDLSSSLDQILRNMAQSKRNDISRAIRDNLKAQPTSDMHIVRDMVFDIFERQKKKINHSILEGILFHFANSSNSFAYVVYFEDKAIAADFLVFDKRTAYNILGGYQRAGHHRGAGALADFESIKHSKELGLRVFDFEGSMIPSIEAFNRGYGGQLTPYFTINKAWLPLEMALKFVSRQRF